MTWKAGLMTITANSVVVNLASPADITLAKFKAVLADSGSPAFIEAEACYQAIIAEGVSVAFALSVFAHESRYGTDPNSIVVKFGTKNPGNTRSSTIGSMPLVNTDRGVFVKFDKWATGFRDLAHRLIAKDYVYAQEGRKTITQIIERWAPKGDFNNDPEKYINAVVSLMNKWIGEEGEKVGVSKPNITWIGSPNCWSDRSGRNVIAIVNHIMQGSLESTDGWFNNPASQVSAHFGVGKDGRIHQYVSLDGAAWANGVAEHIDNSIPWLVGAVGNGINENNLTISIEHEGNTGDPMPEAQYQATLALHRWLLSLYPAIKVDRQHIIGHYQISGTIKVNCPGKGFPWPRLMADLAPGSSPALPDGFILDTSGHNAPGTLIDTSTGFLINQPFADYWLNNGGLEKFGRPIEYGLHGEAGSPGAVVKEFQYAKMYINGGKVVAEMKDRTNPKGFDVGVGILAKAKEHRAYHAHKRAVFPTGR
jgi:N-acetyl-anhydromuramyl-L-alanine amidase AmpD